MIPHLCLLLFIILLSTITYYYNVYLPSKESKLNSPENFSTFIEEFNNIVKQVVEPKYYSRFNTFNEFKI